ncbi:hypothetical protein JRQ81_006724 [Phrynocephalus forsythii]|uniref:Uncharacterized protein n=1 Tax=Phrynocephalus forsythii TaxID=171643 RepID=A0A9Q0XDQ9_9SAUR|nr:hypothetical protein JRQ81_006724 [Phrynocephalus forsythii]
MDAKEHTFKCCLDCSGKMPITDGHSHCLYCLGEGHRPQICRHCRKFTKIALKARRHDLEVHLMEKALQPMPLFSSKPSSTLLMKVEMKRAASESTKQQEEGGSCTALENLSVLSDRPSAVKSQIPTAEPTKISSNLSPPARKKCKKAFDSESTKKKKSKPKSKPTQQKRMVASDV